MPPRAIRIGWTVLTALLVLGYMVASQVRGFYYDPLLFGVVGVVVGPFAGIALAVAGTAVVAVAFHLAYTSL